MMHSFPNRLLLVYSTSVIFLFNHPLICLALKSNFTASVCTFISGVFLYRALKYFPCVLFFKLMYTLKQFCVAFFVAVFAVVPTLFPITTLASSLESSSRGLSSLLCHHTNWNAVFVTFLELMRTVRRLCQLS